MRYGRTGRIERTSGHDSHMSLFQNIITETEGILQFPAICLLVKVIADIGQQIERTVHIGTDNALHGSQTAIGVILPASILSHHLFYRIVVMLQCLNGCPLHKGRAVGCCMSLDSTDARCDTAGAAV